MTEIESKEYFHRIEENFSHAIVSNNVVEIKKCVTEDWVLVDGQGGVIPQERFFQVIGQGVLSHTTMTKQILRVKIYGNIALVTARGENTATWQGQNVEAEEWVTDIYKKEGGNWLCVLTHLTPVRKMD